MSGYVSNPFQVLGVSDPTPAKQVIHVPDPDSVVIHDPTSPLDGQSVPVVPDPARPGGVVVWSTAFGALAPYTPSPAPVVVAPAPKEHLSFLHHLGTFFLDDVLPIALQVGVPILERKI